LARAVVLCGMQTRIWLVITFASGCYTTSAPQRVAAQPAATPAAITRYRVELRDGARGLAVRGSTAYVLTYDDDLVAITEGSIRYRTHLGRELAGVPAGFQSLELAGGIALITSTEAIAGVDASTGKLLWHRTTIENVSIEGDRLHLTGDGIDGWIEIATGRDASAVTTRPSQRPAIAIESTETASGVVDVTGKRDGKVLWQRAGITPAAGAPHYVQLPDEVLINPATSKTSSVVALDPKTGRPRWTIDVGDPALLLQYGYAGHDLTWLVMFDGAAMRDGDLGYQFFAVTPTGRIVVQAGAPEPDAKRCSADIKWSSVGGSFAVTHGIRSTKRPGHCDMPVIDVYVPRA
jgi:outer membrane protein assembly factor BamB